eukprot:GCRY01000478.1.p1 GENE.GCRY01000478.1~~GCRY01000478.1.p1  ORF type:complete len:459 (+),score=99.33 GCRY01000478.1:206-1582(+)
MSRKLKYSSIDTLNDISKQMPVASTTALKFYFRAGQTLLKNSRASREDGDLEQEYIFLRRFCELGLNLLPEHKDYFDKSYVDFRKNCQTSMNDEALPRLEALKQTLKTLYAQKRKEDDLLSSSHPEPVSSVPTEQEEPSGDLFMMSLEKRMAALKAPAPSATAPPPLPPSHPSSAPPVEAALQAGWDNNHIDAVFLPQTPTAPVVSPPSSHPTSSTASLIDVGVEEVSPPIGPLDMPLYPSLHTRPPRPHSHPSRQPQLPPAYPSQPQSVQKKVVPEYRTEATAKFKTVVIPDCVLEIFLRLAASNNRRNIETCGLLCGKLHNNVFRMTDLVIPKQEGTSDTCSTLNEEEIFALQDSKDLITLGWIHTHPTQACFLSSVDLHTQCAYQTMLPEAVAIVLAPTSRPNFGVFHLHDPYGLGVLQKCPLRGFHTHPGGELYYSDPPHVKLVNEQVNVVDLR